MRPDKPSSIEQTQVPRASRRRSKWAVRSPILYASRTPISTTTPTTQAEPSASPRALVGGQSHERTEKTQNLPPQRQRWRTRRPIRLLLHTLWEHHLRSCSATRSKDRSTTLMRDERICCPPDLRVLPADHQREVLSPVGNQ